MFRNGRKMAYLGIVGFLTCTTISATYWQTTRYLQSRARWDLIGQELLKTEPDALNYLNKQNQYSLKYVQVKNGKLSQNFMLVSRAKEGRMGYLVVRVLYYQAQQKQRENKNKAIVVVEGWIPEDYQLNAKVINSINTKGLLREKQKSDYLHQKMSKQDLQKFKVNTYIDIERAISELEISPAVQVQKNYYLQLLRNSSDTQNHYPYQYSVDNFQLPYLTPDKHRAYALFWGLTTCVGLGAIIKALRMK